MSARIILVKDTALIFFLALVVRFAVVIGYAFGFFNGGLKGGDSVLYFEIARNLVKGNGFATNDGPTAFVSPLYPIFLAGWMSIFGENLLLISFFQSILSALVCVCIYKSCKFIFQDNKAAFIAGVLSAFSFELILWSNAQLLTEPLYVFLFAVAILLLVIALNRSESSNLYFILSGAIFALAALTRPSVIAIAFGIATILFVSSFFKTTVNWKSPIYFGAVFLVVMFPWGMRNYLVFNSFTLSSLEGGHGFWLGNNAQYDTYDHPDVAKFGGYTTMFKPDKPLLSRLAHKSAVEKNGVFANAAWDHIRSDPVAFVKRGFHKNWNMWRPNFSVSSWRNSLLSYTFYPLLLFSAIAGMFLAWRRRKETLLRKMSDPAILLIAIFLMHILIHSVITGEIRFRVPLWVILIPFSSYTFSRILAYISPKSTRTLEA